LHDQLQLRQKLADFVPGDTTAEMTKGPPDILQHCSKQGNPHAQVHGRAASEPQIDPDQ